jgi:polar amino acid transport system ATP-binding protein
MASQATARPVLEVRGLHKRYGETPVLKGLDLTVPAGQTLVIMGPSGRGKSTFVRCLNRLHEPDAGRVMVEGVDLMALDPQALQAERRHIGFVFQHSNLVQRLTAWQNVALGLMAAGVPRGEARERAVAALSRVGLSAKADRRPGQLSGGEQQRVGIARALALSPALMLWDEPTAALDPLLVREVLDVMEELVQARDRTMIVVTHEMSFALRAADRVVLMDQGRIVEDGSPEEVFGAPTSLLGQKYRHLLENLPSLPGEGKAKSGKGFPGIGANSKQLSQTTETASAARRPQGCEPRPAGPHPAL